MSGIAVPLQNYLDQQAQISLVCAELHRLDFKSSLASANVLYGIINDEVSDLSMEEYAKFGGSQFRKEELRVYRSMAAMRYQRCVADLAVRFRDEAGDRQAFFLSSVQEALYSPTDPLFGLAVQNTFPDTTYDIIEGGACLALGRYTACVFHLMRAVESAAQVMAGKIGATTKSREGNTITLGVLLANLKAKIDALPKSAERDNWHEAHALLQSVNISWRTETAHTGSLYTQVEAETVFGATRSFLQFLAERMK